MGILTTYSDSATRDAKIDANFWLTAMIAYNLFRAFFLRNLKTALRRGKSMLDFARIVTAELYGSLAVTGIPP